MACLLSVCGACRDGGSLLDGEGPGRDADALAVLGDPASYDGSGARTDAGARDTPHATDATDADAGSADGWGGDPGADEDAATDGSGLGEHEGGADAPASSADTISDASADMPGDTTADATGDSAGDATDPDGAWYDLRSDALVAPDADGDAVDGGSIDTVEPGDALSDADVPDAASLPFAVPVDAPKLGFSNLVVGYTTAVIDIRTMKEYARIGPAYNLCHGSIVMPGQKAVWLARFRHEIQVVENGKKVSKKVLPSIDRWSMVGDDPTQWKLTKSIEVPWDTYFIAASPDKKVAALAGYDALIFRPLSGKVQAPGLANINMADVSPDGNRVYASNPSDKRIRVLEVATLKVKDTWALPVAVSKKSKLWPVEVRVSPDDKVVVTADFDDAKVSFCDTTIPGGGCTALKTGSLLPHGVAWTNDGTRALVQAFAGMLKWNDEWYNVKVKSPTLIVDRKTHKVLYTLSWPISVSHAVPIPSQTKQEALLLPASFGTILRARMDGTLTGQMVMGKGSPVPAMIVSF